jgi:hypothetical protein
MVEAARRCLIELAGTAYRTGKGFQPDPACQRMVRLRSKRAAQEEARRLARGIWVRYWEPRDYFTYSASVPSVTSLSTTSLGTAGGTSLVITGSAFSGAAAVCFGAVAATGFTVLSDTAIVVTLPPEPAGVWDITVVTPAGTSALVSADRVTVTAASAASVTSFGTPSGSRAGGTIVTVSGSGFSDAINVLFGTLPALSFSIVPGTSLTAISPPGELRGHVGPIERRPVHGDGRQRGRLR